MTSSRQLARTVLGSVMALFVVAMATESYAHGQGHNPSRNHYIMKQGVPKAYRSLLNPLRMTPENLSIGQTLYNENCTTCHGPAGKGDGEGAVELKSAPSRLTGMYARPMRGMGHPGPGGHLMHGMMHHHPGMTHAEAMGGINLDAYNFWSISEGGEAIGSSMPAFKDLLSEKERWQILLYIANRFTTVSSK